MNHENTCYILDEMTGRPPSKDAPDFGKRLAEARKQRRLTQRQLAAVLGVNQKMIEYYERRASNVTAEVIKKIANAFGMSADELLGIKSKRSKPGPKSKLQTQVEQLERLPLSKQQAIIQVLDMAIKSAS